jgi:hypothetical protein
MEKTVAKSLISLAVSMDANIGSMFSEIEKITDEGQRDKFKRAVGDIMGYIARDIIFPIVDEHPDLDPDKQSDL